MALMRQVLTRIRVRWRSLRILCWPPTRSHDIDGEEETGRIREDESCPSMRHLIRSYLKPYAMRYPNQEPSPAAFLRQPALCRKYAKTSPRSAFCCHHYSCFRGFLRTQQPWDQPPCWRDKIRFGAIFSAGTAYDSHGTKDGAFTSSIFWNSSGGFHK